MFTQLYKEITLRTHNRKLFRNFFGNVKRLVRPICPCICFAGWRIRLAKSAILEKKKSKKGVGLEKKRGSQKKAKRFEKKRGTRKKVKYLKKARDSKKGEGLLSEVK